MNKYFTVREHVTLTGPMGEIQEMFDWLKDDDWGVHRFGPKLVSVGREDLEVYLIRASREVKKGRWKP